MSQWDRIVQRQLHDAVAAIYLDFPIAVRGALSVWLEEHLIASHPLNPDADHDHCFSGFLFQMLEELRKFISSITGTEHHWITYRTVLQQSLELIKQKYEHDPKSLYRNLKYYMQQEQNLLNPPMPENLGPGAIIMRLRQLVASTSTLAGYWSRKEVVLHVLMQLQQDMARLRQQTTEIDDEINLVSNGMAYCRDQLLHDKSVATDEITRKSNEFNIAMVELGQLQNAILMQLNSLTEDLTKELDQWIIEQRRNANGFQIERSLDDIGSLYVHIAQGLIQLYKDTLDAENWQQSADRYSHTECPADILYNQRHIKEHILSLLKTIVKKTFLVEAQPYQIIRSKTATKQRQSSVTNTCITLRLLVGTAINSSLVVPVEAYLISEKEAKRLHENPGLNLESKLELVHNKPNLACDEKTQKCTAKFSGVALASKLERRTKKKEFVAADKWCFIFKIEIKVLEESIQIVTFSNPVCITVHPAQDFISWGSLLWDNEFAEPNRAPFDVPSVVDCNRLLSVISKKFEIQTGRGLTSDNLRFLAHKLIGDSPSINGQVTWEMFNRRPVIILKTKKPTPVTFWEYIYEILKLCEKSSDNNLKKAEETNQHFQKYWADGKVEGFIFKEEMEQKLRDSNCEGMMMLRFSDNCLGSVTVNFLHNKAMQWEIQKFLPYSLEDLSKGLSLRDRILTKSCLTYLYPNTPKAIAFPEPQTQRTDSSKSHLYRMGYIRTFMEEKFDTSGLRSRNVSSSSSSTNTSHFNSSGPSSSAAFTPNSVPSPYSPPGGYPDSSNNSTYPEYESSNMDETMEIFNTIREVGLDFDVLTY